MAQLTVARPSRICTGFLTQMVLGRLHQRGVRSPLPGGPRRSARIQVGLHEALRRQGPADDDDRGLGQARGLRCRTRVALVAAKAARVSPGGIVVESFCARVRTTDWATSGTVSSRPMSAAVAA